MATAHLTTIGVVGAGTMGRGIVQLFAQAGHTVVCHDAQPGAAAKAVEYVDGMFARAVEKGRMTANEHDSARSRLTACDSLADLAGCELVIEAIVEDLEVKRALFRELESLLGDHAILASNTSSLTVAEIAAACRRPERVAGLHFFNPVPLMKVAEVIAAVRTAPAVVRRLSELTEGAGHRAVVTADQPGFLINHAGRGLYTEGLRIVEEQVATPADVDDVLREALGFRMGPFELLDLTGLDVSSRVMASIYEQFQQEPRFRPSSLLPPRVAAGLFGRKSGEGWYRYVDGQQQRPPARAVPALPEALAVWVDPAASGAAGLRELAIAAGVRLVDEASNADLNLVMPWGNDATSTAISLGLDATRCVAVDPLPPLALRRTLMLTAVTSPAARDAAHALLAKDGTAVTLINDSPGFIAQRVIATIVNIAANIAQRGIASVADLEDAVRLGLGYPQGPLGWGDRLGAGRLLEILRAQLAATGDPRYRPSAWLVRRVALGLPITTPEALR
ncbi:MAG: 3-hydroxyacyl-CoA dehydrogenase [Hydrogenophaga sp.]|uniref:3-hydroxyacyl-CoA dehydrogenase n=1 Tax=Hydrogenophaga sp. TaxID=1904254 RepID=UPI001691A4B6|nr:3-hydroxyacyl-CoA dehydrogenase [Hydrogenophaga sp.]NIM43852.1 3-hydroxyacyl-CoA dehydrogenase [Hydrogenophaga sp.]NIN28918.1 3-hydroxyacyl-CoA dehydrogenase [Hydrogenophaga sp.]NIN33377.1 3-hydroxyacyl-CoA dehydrogenase [Hydrogenophaga sp.]NIN58052.1 3-hydroxyacyl-CoA dehydrogenase [Hydrogenophaga sp.]NIO54350.1 3-hydroxyacyl-CoA dehydrogenase [Hydrogenophaga sp.]